MKVVMFVLKLLLAQLYGHFGGCGKTAVLDYIYFS